MKNVLKRIDAVVVIASSALIAVFGVLGLAEVIIVTERITQIVMVSLGALGTAAAALYPMLNRPGERIT